MIGGTIIAMPNNPPKFEGIPCQCSGKSGGCSLFLWSRFAAVRTMRGAVISPGCAVRLGVATWDELKTSWREFLESGQMPKGPKLKPVSKRDDTRSNEDLKDLDDLDSMNPIVTEPKPKTRRRKKSSEPDKKSNTKNTSKTNDKKTTGQVAQEALRRVPRSTSWGVPRARIISTG